MASKFRVIKQLKEHKATAHMVPDLWRVSRNLKDLSGWETLFNGQGRYILRSALSGEGEPGSWRSGVSLSFGQICSMTQFDEAYRKISEQKDLSEIIIQKEVTPELHVTGVFYHGLAYMEQTFTKGSVDKCFLSQDTYSGRLSLPPKTHSALKMIEQVSGLSSFLVEMGVLGDEVFIYQVMPVDHLKSLPPIFSDAAYFSWLTEFAANPMRWSVNELMKDSLRAWYLRRRFARRTLKRGDLKARFCNWRAILFFFQLFCLTRWSDQYEKSISGFYRWMNRDSSWVTHLIDRHLEIAGFLSEGEDGPSGLWERLSAPMFCGQGQRRLKAEDISFIENLEAKWVYNQPSDKVILTKDRHFLSHGFLAALEKKMPLVAGVSDEAWRELLTAQVVDVDFDRELVRPFRMSRISGSESSFLSVRERNLSRSSESL